MKKPNVTALYTIIYKYIVPYELKKKQKYNKSYVIKIIITSKILLIFFLYKKLLVVKFLSHISKTQWLFRVYIDGLD